jgi:myo-inositol-1(or 4)-monophosphatase
MVKVNLAHLLSPLGDIAVQAGQIAIQARQQMVREEKPDGSVVTNADREVEQYLRSVLPSLLPGTTIWGEEYGFSDPGPEGLWLVDPVDGTTNFAHGSPLWGVSIALLRGTGISLGAIVLPDLGELYLAAAGEGVTCNGVPLPPIPPGEVMRRETVGYSESVMRLGIKIPGRMRCSGAFVVEGVWVMQQRYRGMVGVREQLYDIAPCLLFAQELGAEVRYLDGTPFDIGELTAPVKIAKPWIIFPAESGFTG